MFSLVCRAAPITAAIAILSAPGLTAAFGAVNGAGDVSQGELEQLDAAARRYRVQVYQTYRLDRNEFDRRKAAGDEVQARWRVAGGRKEDLSAVLQWLEQGAYFSQWEVRRNLPDFPLLGAPESSPLGTSKSDPEARRSSPRVTKQPYVQVRPAPVPRVNAYDIAPPREFAPVAPAHNIIAPPAARQLEGHPQESAPSATRPRVERALLPAPWEVVSPAPSRLNSALGAAPVRRAEIGLAPVPGRVDQPSRLPAQAYTPARAAPGVATAPPVQPSPRIDALHGSARKYAAPTTIGKQTNESGNEMLPPPPTVVRRQPRGGDFGGRPSGDPARSPRIALAKPDLARSADAILATPSQAAEPLPTPASQLNVGELLARASGYGFGLRTIDSVLHEQNSLDPAELSHLLSELEALVDQRGDLMLYEQLVSADVRERLVGSLRFPQTTVAELGSRIAAARERLTQQTGVAAQVREVDLQALADLSRRLARLSQK